MSRSFTHSSLSPAPMSYKPTATNGGYFAVPGWSGVSLRGEHATAFAQAQFMGDLSPLAPGHWQWNGWLTPKGRLIALFALAALDERTLAVLLADAAPEAFVEALSRFRFRSRVEIAHEPDWRVDGRLGAPDSAQGARLAGSGPATDLELDLGAAGRPPGRAAQRPRRPAHPARHHPRRARRRRTGGALADPGPGPRPAAPGRRPGRRVDAAAALARPPARLQRAQGLLPGPGDRGPHPFPRPGQARAGAPVGRRRARGWPGVRPGRGGPRARPGGERGRKRGAGCDAAGRRRR